MEQIKDKVVVRLLGGLGNQLFQYAMGRSLADRYGCDLLLDKRYIERKGFVSGLAIEHFNIRAEYLTERQLANYPEWAWKLSRAVRRNWRPWLNFYHEIGFTFDHQLNRQVLGKMLSGFWQSYRYFEDSDFLFKDLTVKRKLPDDAEELKVAMADVNSVAVHVRRGDYVADAKALAKHGLCSLGYYRKAVEEIKCRVDKPQFYVFSDDPSWVRDNISLPDSVFVSDKGFAQEVDLSLIASCKHQIIANSSFSWWGGFLNPNIDKVVIAPSPWFDVESLPDVDLCPPSWMRIAKY